MINKVYLIGRAGRDPDIKYFESGKCLTTLSLAVDRRPSSNNEPDWFDLEMWDRTAEIAANYIKKGQRVGIIGSLKFNRWKDKDTGEMRQRPVILVDELELL